jgi:hypothetical protein
MAAVRWSATMKSTEMNNDSEPPSCPQPIFMIGQDGRGNWVVRDETGIRGGLFVDRVEALRYIRSESGASVMAAECLELDIPAAVVAMPPPAPSLRSIA